MDGRRLSARRAGHDSSQNPAYRRARPPRTRQRSVDDVAPVSGRADTGQVLTPSKRDSENTYPWGNAATPYLEIGGAEGVTALAETFYDVIDEDSPRLRGMLPRNISKTRQKFSMYLSGWMGGPPLYEERWGHPRLRMRHLPFEIGQLEAEEWMRCMRVALKRCEVPAPLSDFLEERFTQLAQHMRNQPD